MRHKEQNRLKDPKCRFFTFEAVMSNILFWLLQTKSAGKTKKKKSFACLKKSIWIKGLYRIGTKLDEPCIHGFVDHEL